MALEAKIDSRFNELRAELHKTTADTVKWHSSNCAFALYDLGGLPDEQRHAACASSHCGASTNSHRCATSVAYPARTRTSRDRSVTLDVTAVSPDISSLHHKHPAGAGVERALQDELICFGSRWRVSVARLSARRSAHESQRRAVPLSRCRLTWRKTQAVEPEKSQP
jgi:hypothetical protein